MTRGDDHPLYNWEWQVRPDAAPHASLTVYRLTPTEKKRLHERKARGFGFGAVLQDDRWEGLKP